MDKPIKYLLLISILLLCSNTYSKCNEKLTKQTIDYIIYELDEIKKNFKHTDVTKKVDLVKYALNYCDISLNKFGLGKGVFTYWSKISQEAEYKKLKEHVKFKSHLGTLKEQDINNLKRYASLLDKNLDNLDQLHERNISSKSKTKNNCTTKDNRTDSLGEVRNQDSIGWCYAFAAADMLGQKLGQRVSAIDVALTYNDSLINDMKLYFNMKESDIVGGFATKAIQKAQKRGLCLEKNLSSDEYAYSTLKESLIQIEDLKQAYDEAAITRIDLCDKDLNYLTDRFKNLNITDILNVLETSTNVTYIDMLSDKACGKRIKLKDQLKVVTSHASNIQDRMNLFDEMDKVISNGELTGISYDANILSDLDNEDDPGWHFSTVVGRRFNSSTNSCEYLVRNSWGRGCEGYDERLECEEGNIWVPKQVLAKRMRRIDYFR